MNYTTPYKSRTINIDKPVSIYRNLLKKGVVYSIKQNGYVVAHTTSLTLSDCVCKVNYTSQAKIRTTKVREVHAHITGKITDEEFYSNYFVYYNPFTFDDFFVVTIEHEKVSITGADIIYFGTNGLYAKNIQILK